MNEDELQDKGYTQEEIAEMFGFNRQYVKFIVDKYEEKREQ